MTRLELEVLSAREQSEWLREAGWEVDNTGRMLVWRLKSKGEIFTMMTFQSACELQLKFDAQKLVVEKRFNYNLENFDPLKDAVVSSGDDLTIENKTIKEIEDAQTPPWTGDNLLRLAFRAGVAWGRFQKTSKG